MCIKSRARATDIQSEGNNVESAHIHELYPGDFDYIDRPEPPVVVVYNGSNHFCSSLVMSPKDYNKWKLNTLVTFSQAALQIISKVDEQHISDKDNRQVAVLKDVLSKTIKQFKGKQPTVVATGGSRKRSSAD